MARDLTLYDEALRMHAARGLVSTAAADAMLRLRALALIKSGATDGSHRALLAFQQTEADAYFQFIDGVVAKSPRWPKNAPAQASQQEAATLMASVRPGYQQAIAGDDDPAPALATAYRVLRLASGDPNILAATTPFDNRATRVAAALAAAHAPLRAPPGGSIGISIRDSTVAGKRVVSIVAVHPGSAGAAAGLHVGDVIVSLERKPVVGAHALHQSIQALQPGRIVALGVVRAGKPLNVWVKLGAALPAAAAPLALRRFENPMVQGVALDGCQSWAKNCGQPAADAFCRLQGFAAATEFTVRKNAPPTRVIGSGQICNQAFCGRIASVTCRGTAPAAR
ncbi:MAG: PDZ domain-containing protein [Alphaproteobacteria bacterium]|nr:PDZ domain-containing protein [Alphaproteobacteria bacterium]